MTELSERLRFLMDREGLSQKGLSELTGASAQSVHNWLKRNSISKDSAKLVSERTGYSLDWLLNNVGQPKLLGPQGDTAITNAGTDVLHDFYRVEVLDLVVSAGPGRYMLSEAVEVLNAIEFTSDRARALFGSRAADDVKVMTVDGDSMFPTIKSGDRLFFDVSVREFTTDGVYAFVYGKTFHVKRLQMQGTRLVVLSDNPNLERWEISEDTEDQFYVMGKALLHESIMYGKL